MSLTSNIVDEITSNPVTTRDDLVHLLATLLKPLASGQSDGGARIQIGFTGTSFDPVAAELEGFSRAIWGLAPLLSCDPDRREVKQLRESWVKGLDSGSSPELRDEYWGKCGDRDQRFVEMAPIGFALTIAPKVFWDPLSTEAKERLNDWLLQINDLELPENNWRFFLILTNLGLKSVGARYSQKRLDETLEFIESWYGPHGFPSDGPNKYTKAYDYYATSFAIPFYSLIYAKLCSKTDPDRAALFRKRAIANIPCVVNLFGPDGGAIPFGRSMTYRFAVSCFWAAVAFDDELELPAPFTLGVVKGLLLRNIRWFTHRPECFHRDGSLSIGYTAPCQYMSETYNSPQSPYWALKAFLVLALPESHPFWQAREEPYPASLLEKPHTVMEPWMQVFSHAAGHIFLLSSGQMTGRPGDRGAFAMRQTASKYGKLAYSSAFGFSVPVGAMGLEQHAPDSSLALCDDELGERWVVRRQTENVEFITGGIIKSTWTPWPKVNVTTWLIPPSTTTSAYHTRVHKIVNSSDRKVQYSEGGFAIHSTSGPLRSERNLTPLSKVDTSSHGFKEDGKSVMIVSKAGVSGSVSLLSDGRGRALVADGNSNLIAQRTMIPIITGQCKDGVTWVAVRVFAIPRTAEGQMGTVGDKWVTDWEECKAGLGGLEGLKKEYPFLD